MTLISELERRTKSSRACVLVPVELWRMKVVEALFIKSPAPPAIVMFIAADVVALRTQTDRYDPAVVPRGSVEEAGRVSVSDAPPGVTSITFSVSKSDAKSVAVVASVVVALTPPPCVKVPAESEPERVPDVPVTAPRNAPVREIICVPPTEMPCAKSTTTGLKLPPRFELVDRNPKIARRATTTTTRLATVFPFLLMECKGFSVIRRFRITYFSG